MKTTIIKSIISLIGIIVIWDILSRCIEKNIDGVIIASGLTLVGFCVGLMFDVNIFKFLKRKK